MSRETAGPYRLLERTGEDRLGETWRARDTARGRTASVRLIHPQIAGDPVARAALLSDARQASAVSHPAVALLFDVIDENEGIALAHEHVEGRTLAATLGGTPLNPRLAVAIAVQVADGLAELHAAGITHGAVDAAHVVITPRGQAKVIDAGLVRWLSPSAEIVDDIEAMGALLASMTGRGLPTEPWSTDLRSVIERTRPDHPRRYGSMPALAADLRGVSIMLEARAEAAPPVTRGGGSGASVLLWALLAAILLALGAWFLVM